MGQGVSKEASKGPLLLAASEDGDVATVRALLERSTVDEVVATNEHGQTSLHVATIKGHVKIVELLLQAGANPNAGNHYDKTPLHKASSKGFAQVVALLLQAHANPNAKNKDGETPLYKASSKGHVHVVDLLLQADADPDAPDKTGKTSLHKAASAGNLKIMERLLKTRADANAQDEHGQTPLHNAANAHASKIVRALLASGAAFDAKDKEGRTPFHVCMQSRTYPGLSSKTLQTLQALVSDGATWDAACEDMVAHRLAWVQAPALRVCALLWASEKASGQTLTNIPLEVIDLGVDSVHKYLTELKRSRDVVLRRKICLVGSSCAGKTSLVKSITSERPQLVHVDDRTIGIDHFPLRFDESSRIGHTGKKVHEATFWDFAGQDAYQVAHALFFSPRTLYFVCVDLEAFVMAYMQAIIVADTPMQETQLVNEFIDYTVMRWINLVLARQPDAELVFIVTKEDSLAENEATAQLLLKHALEAKLKEVETTAQAMRRQLSQMNEEERAAQTDRAFFSEMPLGVNPTEPTVVYVSCVSAASVRTARTDIQELIISSDHSFEMPDSYSKALKAIMARRAAATVGDITTRIDRLVVPVDTLPAALELEPTLCRTILHTLHDLGDVLWFEHLRVEWFQHSVVLDPLLLIDFIRQVIHHKHTGVTMAHVDLKSLPFWVELSNPRRMEAMKTLLQRFHLVYSANDGRIMEWDSDLIVPAYWQTKIPAAWLFLGDILRLTSRLDQDPMAIDWARYFSSTRSSRDAGDLVRVHWEYHFEARLPLPLFDHVVVASVSPFFALDAGPDWIIYRDQAMTACRIMVGRDPVSLHRTIHVEAVASEAASPEQIKTLWSVFKLLHDALVLVLSEYQGLVVSSFAWDGANNKVSLKRLLKSNGHDASAAWMPPAAAWQ